MDLDLPLIFNRYQQAIDTIHLSVNNTIVEHVRADITTDQFSTLQYIHHHKACTSTQIAQSFGVGKSAITALTNRLYDKKLIIRERDESDRRMIYLKTTDTGQALIKQTEKELYKMIGEKLSHFEADEIETFIQALEKLAHLMDD